MKNKLKQWGIVFMLTGLVFAAGIILFPGSAQMATKPGDGNRDMVNLPPLESLPGAAGLGDGGGLGTPSLESVLERLVRIYKTEGIEAAAQFAQRRIIPFKDGFVRVSLDVKPAHSFNPLTKGSWEKSPGPREPQTPEAAISQAVSLVNAEVEGLGGQVVKTYRYQVDCRIGIQSLEELARLPLVRSIRLPLRPRPQVTSEGISKTGADGYYGLYPFKSAGVKVCVIDVGFKGYNGLLGSELPGSVTAKSFTESGDIEAGEVHGTACAEIIHDMAPDAQLYLANIYWNTDLIDAVEWAVDQKVDIISYSLGTYFGAGDGTGLDSALAQWVKENSGITWVAAAGNSADDHWSGTFNDPDSDGWHNFSGEDEILSFYVPAQLGIEYGVSTYLKWNDWGTWDDYYGYSGSDQDYDLFLFVWDEDASQWLAVDSSQNQQPQFAYPWESIEGWYALHDAYWGIAIRKKQATKNVFFDLYILTHSRGSVEYNVPAGSLSCPADSPYVIAVGAVDAVDDSYHYYSSQGPTADGRIKPDLCAPSAVSTSDTTYGLRSVTGGFAGTSASCPHVAGAFALLKGKTPFSLDEIKSILFRRAIDMGTPGMDNKYGRGRLNLRK